MPIYEYQCESCEQRTEAIQRIDEAPLTLCPHCGGPLVKLMSAPSFQFKGTGWYVTDYGGAKGGGGADKGSGAKDETSSSSTAKGESSSSGSSTSGDKSSGGGSDSASSKSSS